MCERFERFMLAISEITRYWHKLAAEEMSKYGLKGPHVLYFVIIYRHKDGITASQISELCGKDKSDVSRMMSIMEQKGLVRKEGGSQNLYRGVYKLTDEGKEVARHFREKIDYAVSFVGKDISDSDRAVFYESIQSIVDNLQALYEEGIPAAHAEGL